jgi:regulator of replication initiation timing
VFGTSATIDLPAWLALVGSFIGIVSAIAAAIAVARQAAIKVSLATIVEANAELRKANDDLRHELTAAKLETAQLKGRLDAVTSHLADQILSAVAVALKERP